MRRRKNKKNLLGQEEKEDFGEAGGAYQPCDSGLIQSGTEIKERSARESA